MLFILPHQELIMNFPLFLQCFSRTNDVSGRYVIQLHFFNPIKHCIKDSLAMQEFYVVCRQSSFLLTAHYQQLYYIIEYWFTNRIFNLWQCILICFEHAFQCLVAALINMYFFVIMTSYGDILQMACLHLYYFLLIMHQQYHFNFINAEHIVVLWQIPPR